MRIQGRTVLGAVAILSVGAVAALVSEARSLVIDMPRRAATTTFQMLDRPVATPMGAAEGRQASSLRGSSLAALPNGAVLIDSDSGKLVRVDHNNKVVASMTIAPRAAQLVVDRSSATAYIADRRNDRVVVVDVRTGLKKLRTFKTSAEPFGVALTPDHKTLLVTTVADRQLHAFDTTTGKQRWQVRVGPEPRGVAISPDGKRAVVTFLQTSAVARVALRGDKKPHISFKALNRRRAHNRRPFRRIPGVPSSTNPNVGRSFARAAFTATYVGKDMAVIAHQTSTPMMSEPTRENTGTYGGGGSFNLPVEHHVTFIGEPKNAEVPIARMAQAKIGNHQPRAMFYDGKRDLLLITGYGSDDIIALASASRPSIRFAWRSTLSGVQDGCGPVGIDVADNGKILVHCALSRTIATVEVPKSTKRRFAKVAMSKPLTKSRLSNSARRGRKLFRMGRNVKLSTRGAMACSSCHPEARTDGLSWRIGGKSLQTPILAARVLGTHPFKWDGGDANIEISLRSTVTRLGGRGISKAEAKDIQNFLATLPRPRVPTAKNKAAVARGKKLFDSKAIGCAKCHNGKQLTNGKKYDVADDMPKGVDTPSLIGLATSAPYYHDGSAATLRALLLQNGTIHSMGKLGKLRGKQIDDLIAYLETL